MQITTLYLIRKPENFSIETSLEALDRFVFPVFSVGMWS